MYIKKLILKNFQKHAKLEIDFVNGVNVLFGSSDAGKSCIRRAIEWITQNENIDGIRKTGTKKTSVAILLDNNVEIERVRSQSINRYILREGEEEKVFDSVGRSVPEEIQNAIGIDPIEVDGEKIYLNSQPQIALPFLFDKSPSFRMKLFNKLTGNDVLDKLFGQFNKDILRIKRNAKEEQERYEERAKELKEKEIEKEKAEALHMRLKVRVQNVKKLYEKYSKLLELQGLEEKIIASKQEAKHLLNRFKFPKDVEIKELKEKIDRLDTLKTALNAIEKHEIGIARVRADLKNIVLPVLNWQEIQGKLGKYDTLKSLKSKLDNNKDVCYTLKRDIKINEKELSVSVDNYKRLLKESKYCPICKQEMTDDCIKEIKL